MPRGFRVVWRPAAAPAEISAAQFLLDLPAAGRALTVVARRRRRRIAAMVELAVTGLRVLLEAGAQRVSDVAARADRAAPDSPGAAPAAGALIAVHNAARPPRWGWSAPLPFAKAPPPEAMHP